MVLGEAVDKIKVMLQLFLAYLFATSTSIAIVYLARRNRKQGWQRPAPKWFGAEFQNSEPAMPAPLGMESEPDRLLPQLLNLSGALAAHGTSARPEIESPTTPELVTIRRV